MYLYLLGLVALHNHALKNLATKLSKWCLTFETMYIIIYRSLLSGLIDSQLFYTVYYLATTHDFSSKFNAK